MTYMYGMLGAFVLSAIVLLFLVWRVSSKRTLRPSDAKRIRELWLLTLRIDDPVRKILEADKILDTALGLLGYKGTLGEKLKKASPRFSNSQSVWDAHKLRNTVAHEHHEPTKERIDRSMKSFEQALRELGM